jgi:hypothetical protein
MYLRIQIIHTTFYFIEGLNQFLILTLRLLYQRICSVGLYTYFLFVENHYFGGMFIFLSSYHYRMDEKMFLSRYVTMVGF